VLEDIVGGLPNEFAIRYIFMVDLVKVIHIVVVGAWCRHV